MSWLNVKLKPLASKQAKASGAEDLNVQLRPVEKDLLAGLKTVQEKPTLRPIPKLGSDKNEQELEEVLLSPIKELSDKTNKSETILSNDEGIEVKKNLDDVPVTTNATDTRRKEELPATVPDKIESAPKSAAGRPFIIGDTLRNIAVRKGQLGKFEIKFGGRPEPTCAWSKDGTEIASDGKKIKIESSLGKSSITIRDGVRGDTGVYRATISNSRGVCDSEAEFVVLDKPPTPKGPLVAQKITPTSITLKWQRPEKSKESEMLSGYILEKFDFKTKKWTRSGMCGPNHDTITAENLTPNTSYKFRIRAVNKDGESDPLEIDETITTSDPTVTLLPPRKPTVTYNSGDSVNLNWTAENKEDTGILASKFVVQMKKRDSKIWSDATEVIGSTTTANVAGLEQDSPYDFRVVAFDEDGMSETSEIARTAKVSAPCIDRTTLGKRLIGEGEMVCMGVGVTGFPCPQYFWTFENEELSNDRMKSSEGIDQAVLIVYKAARQDTGIYTLKAVNDLGEDEASLEFVVIGQPGPPTGPLEVTEVDSDSCVLRWQKPEDDGGNAEEVVYRVFKKAGLSANTDWEEVGETPNENLKVTGFSPDESYHFKVISVNSQGESAGLETTTETIFRPSVRKSAPQINSIMNDLTVGDGDEISFTVNFTGEQPPKSAWYHNDEELDSTGDDNLAISNEPYGTTLLIKRATAGHRGTYRLRAWNSLGEDEISASVTFMRKPLQPTDLTVSETGPEECTLSWKPNAEEESPVQYYQVYRCLQSSDDWVPIGKVTEPRITVGELEAGQQYKFRIHAVNMYGQSHGIETGYSVKRQQRERLNEQQGRCPTFIRELTYSGDSAGKEMTLECEASSDSLMTAQWFRNGREITYSPRFLRTFYGGIYRLTVTKFQGIDAGEYTCVLTNATGKSASSVRLPAPTSNCRQRRPVDLNTMYHCNPKVFFYKNYGRPIQTSAYKPMQFHRARNLFQRNPCVVEKEAAPSFTFRLRPRIVQPREGSCKLTCCIVGNPKPKITWYFESNEVDKLEHKMTFVDGFASLEIEDCKPRNSGEYRCVASNLLGSCETICIVVIEAEKV